jgi:glycosyltransferase involved in cell wall biosynthesis
MREKGHVGLQTHMAMAAKVLKSDGFGVKTITPFTGRRIARLPLFALRRIVQLFGGQLNIAWFMFWHYIYLRAALRDELKRQPVADIIYAQCPISARAALKTRPSPATRVVMVTHFNESQAIEWVQKGMIKQTGWLFRKITLFEESVLPELDGITYVSKFMHDVIHRRIPEIKLIAQEVVPNFVSDVPQPNASPSGDLITIGSLEPRKNQQFILRVLGEMRRRHVSLTLTVIGDGVDRKSLESLAAALGIQEQVRFMGSRSDARSLIAGHRLYVHAATMENMPIVLIESLAASVPIVAARVGGIPEVLRDGENGRFWDLDDIASSATTVQDLLDDEICRRKMAIRCREYYESKYSLTSAGKTFCRFMRTIIGGRYTVESY